MGNNLDLIELLNLPTNVKCKRCNNSIRSGFEEYDIDCGDPEASKNNGYLTLDVYCDICEHSNEHKFKFEEVI
jgi:hypothetical protein